MNRRLEQGRRSKEEILDAAARIMSQRGYSGTSISAISKETGLPNSSIYWHFESKAALLAAVMERGAERFFAETSVAPDVEGEPVDRLRAALMTAADALGRHEEFLRLLFLLLLSNDEPDVAPVVARVRAEGRHRLRLTIANAYAVLGDDVAARVADETADFALATFDGVFLAAQFDKSLVLARGIDRMAIGVDAVVARILERGTASPAGRKPASRARAAASTRPRGRSRTTTPPPAG